MSLLVTSHLYVIIYIFCVFFLKFPRSNLGNILSKIKSVPEEKQSEIKKFLALNDPDNTGVIPYYTLRCSTSIYNSRNAMMRTIYECVLDVL